MAPGVCCGAGVLYQDSEKDEAIAYLLARGLIPYMVLR